MPEGTPAMLTALRALADAQHTTTPPPRITSNVLRALVSRGLISNYPTYELTEAGERAATTGRVPRIRTHNNVTFARLEDNTHRPSHYRCYIRHGYDLTRHNGTWTLTNRETGEEERITFTDGQRPTVDQAIINAAPIVQAWITRDSSEATR